MTSVTNDEMLHFEEFYYFLGRRQVKSGWICIQFVAESEIKANIILVFSSFTELDGSAIRRSYSKIHEV